VFEWMNLMIKTRILIQREKRKDLNKGGGNK
jgi:hypothetical protein